MDSIEIGCRLRDLREKTGLSAKEVSEILLDKYNIDMNYRTLFNYEKGRSSPDIDRFLALCMVYHCKDILFEFDYTDIKGIHNSEETELIEKYQKLPDNGKDIIRGALGVEKRESLKMDEIF